MSNRNTIQILSRGERIMNTEVSLFGYMLQMRSHLLANKITEIHQLRNHSPEPDRKEIIEWRSKLFQHLGYALSEDYEKAQAEIQDWADLQEQKVPHEYSLTYYLNSVFYSRKLILCVLENEIKDNTVSPAALLEILKVIDPLLDHATSSLTNNYTKNTYSTETDEDLIITLEELKDFKFALNEATIFAVTDQNNTISYVNDHFCKISKYSRDELIGKDHGEIFKSGYHTEEYLNNILHSIQQGKVWKGEICNKAKDGTLYWVDTTIIPFLNYDGKTYKHISIQYDITEQKKTEEMLLKSEKLSLVGELAAGLAHEIRNPLTTIKGLVQVLQETTEDKKVVYSDIILTEIDRINYIVSEFMVLAKPHAIYFNECNLTDILKKVIYLLEAEANLKNVVILHDFADDDVILYGEKNQLTQVFVNLLKNAMEALPNGGIIRVSTSLVNDKVRISIEDNGVGMTEEQVKKIGEPFYTTKATGTGLGLMVSYKIIQNHKGSISVKSELNKGTTFDIILPLMENNAMNTYSSTNK
jgi:PAS domain S-box-containing protein